MSSASIPPPTVVLTAVFAAWAAGTIVLGAASRFMGEIGAGHFKVIWLSAAGLSLCAGFGYRPMWIVAALCVATFGAIYRRWDRFTGIAAAIVAGVVLVAGALHRGVVPEEAATALLLGAVTNAMLLGHWHLNQPKLGTAPIKRLVWVLWAGLAAYLVATALLVPGAKGITQLGGVTGFAFAAFSLILTAMVTHLVRTRSIMSATGILYLEILMLFVASFTGTLAALART